MHANLDKKDLFTEFLSDLLASATSIMITDLDHEPDNETVSEFLNSIITYMDKSAY